MSDSAIAGTVLRRLLLLIACLAASRLSGQQADPSKAIVERTATAHPIHYFVSLPSGWNPQRTWPLLVVIPQLLAHPERIRAVAVVTPNFLGRCITPATRALTDAESQTPVRVFYGGNDPAWTSTSPLFVQSARFDSLARTRGFRNVSDSLIRSRGHGALAADVLGYFSTLLK